MSLKQSELSNGLFDWTRRMERKEERFASASLQEGDSPFRGHLDEVTGLNVEGWAVDLRALGQNVEVKLFLDDTLIATRLTSRLRDDVSAGMSMDATPGFKFEEVDLKRLQNLVAFRPNGRVNVRNGDRELRSTHPATTLSAFLQSARMNREDKSLATIELASILLDHQASAVGSMSTPLRPAIQAQAGFVEAIGKDASDLVWLLGWFAQRPFDDMPVVVVDRQKFPGAIAAAFFTRDDLAEGSLGFVGVMRSEWQPVRSSQAHIYFGTDFNSYLKVLQPTTLVASKDVADTFIKQLATSTGGHRQLLHDLITSSSTWSVFGAAVGFTVEAAVDRGIIFVGFGALITGWILSPVKKVTGFVVRMGSTILTCDENSLTWTERRDLRTASYGQEQLHAKAGFSAMFRGILSIRSLAKPTLKVFFEDGTSSNFEIDERVIGRVGHGLSFDAVDALFPSLRFEPFFPDLAAAIRREQQLVAKPITFNCWAPARAAIVIVTPSGRHDLFLLFECLSRWLRLTPVQPGIVLISDRVSHKDLLLALFAGLVRLSPDRHSLLFVEEVDYSLYALSTALLAVGADRFTFVARDILFTDKGWQTAVESIYSDDQGPLLFGVFDKAQTSRPEEFSARCFAWRSHAFIAWLEDLPFFLTGFDNKQVFPPQVEPVLSSNLAQALQPRRTSRLIEAINSQESRP